MESRSGAGAGGDEGPLAGVGAGVGACASGDAGSGADAGADADAGVGVGAGVGGDAVAGAGERTMSDRPALSIRPATEDDLRFVRASWFESFRHGGYAPQVAFPTYRAGQSFVIERCLKKGRCYVAFATEVPDEVVSWVVVEENMLHFVYTKQVYRRLGTALMLARHAFAATKTTPNEHTHDTKVGRSFAAKIGTKLNPYLLYL